MATMLCMLYFPHLNPGSPHSCNALEVRVYNLMAWASHLAMPEGGGGPNSGEQEFMPVIPTNLAARWEKLHYVTCNCSSSLAFDTDDGAFFPPSLRCIELAISSSSSALGNVTKYPDGPGRADGPLASQESLVSDIEMETKSATVLEHSLGGEIKHLVLDSQATQRTLG